MENNEKIKYLIAYSNDKECIARIMPDNKLSDTYLQFLHDEKDNGLEEKEFETEITSSLTLMIEPFWSLTTKDEKLKILNATLERFAGQPFDGYKRFGLEDETIAPIYPKNEKIFFNLDALDYNINPIVYLTAILSAKQEIENAKYENDTTPIKSVLDFKNINELRTRYIITSIDMECSEEESKFILQKYYQDMPICRARSYNVLKSAELLIETAQQFEPIANEFMNELFEYTKATIDELKAVHKTLDATDKELQTLATIEKMFKKQTIRVGVLDYVDMVKEVLEVADKRRDATYVDQANDSLNESASRENRFEDIIERETALAHFGYTLDDLPNDYDYDGEYIEDEEENQEEEAAEHQCDA